MVSTSSESRHDWQSESGGFIEGSGERAFSFRYLANPEVPILIASPHAGRSYPESLRDEARDHRVLERRLEDRHVESIAEKISSNIGASLLVANSPRAMLDLNRSVEDVDWSMIAGSSDGSQKRTASATRRARSGLGLVPRRLAGFGELWRKTLPYSRLQDRISGIHLPYHRKLGLELERLRDAWGYSILVDLHSMPPLSRTDQSSPKIEFVIGDRFGASCNSALSFQITDHLRSQGWGAAQNRPYSGCYTLDRHGRPRRDIHAVQIEVCRSSYLDADLDMPTARSAKISDILSEALRLSLASLTNIGIAAE